MQCLDTFKGQDGVIYSVSWSPDDNLMVSGSSKGSVVVWDTTTGMKRHVSGALSTFFMMR
jgi:WD40 repeat protein